MNDTKRTSGSNWSPLGRNLRKSLKLRLLIFSKNLPAQSLTRSPITKSSPRRLLARPRRFCCSSHFFIYVSGNTEIYTLSRSKQCITRPATTSGERLGLASIPA